jgi:hypothetical protein
MPELTVRRDSAGWVTPSIPEVLDPIAEQPYDDAFVQGQIKKLVDAMNEAEVPVRVVGADPLPSHLIVALEPGTVGGLVNRRRITREEIIAKVREFDADIVDAEAISVLPSLQRAQNAVGMLIHYPAHERLPLRQILLQPAYENARSYTTIPLGITPEGVPVLRDLAALGHVWAIGSFESNPLNLLLTTLLLTHTPSQFRYALITPEAKRARPFAGDPHLTGPPITAPEDCPRMLALFSQEVGRRASAFEAAGVSDLDAYNARALDMRERPLPRVVIFWEWAASWDSEGWLEPLEALLEAGSEVGVHVVIASERMDDVPQAAQVWLNGSLIARDALEIFPEEEIGSLPLPFLDAVLLVGEEALESVQLCAAPAPQLDRLLDYWREAVKKRTASQQRGEPQTRTAPAAAQQVDVFQQILDQSRALAAYLGWLGPGALRDILRLDEAVADDVITTLTDEGLLAESTSPVKRYVNPHRRSEA